MTETLVRSEKLKLLGTLGGPTGSVVSVVSTASLASSTPVMASLLNALMVILCVCVRGREGGINGLSILCVRQREREIIGWVCVC